MSIRVVLNMLPKQLEKAIPLANIGQIDILHRKAPKMFIPTLVG